MRFENPTRLNIGQAGTLLGTHYRVAGRIVMGMEEEGETYYWQEFHLVGAADETAHTGEGETARPAAKPAGAEIPAATLVYEETEKGPQWRLFTYVETENPLTADQAAAKRVGERVKLNDQEGLITLVDESRVYHIEGVAPEGVEVGDVARYFNAVAGGEMLVVSWTGTEVEYYRGHNLPTHVVERAFGLERAAGSSYEAFARSGAERTSSAVWIGIVGAIAAVVMGIVGYAMIRARPSVVRRPAAPPAVLKVGTAGVIHDTPFRVRARSQIEIARVGGGFAWQEYELLGDATGAAFLVNGFTPGQKDWRLFTPVSIDAPLGPEKAAALKAGEQVRLGGQQAMIRELWRGRTIEGQTGPEPSAVSPARIWYGFRAEAAEAAFLVRWDAREVVALRGDRVDENLVTAFK